MPGSAGLAKFIYDDGNRYADVTWSDFDGLGHYRQSTTGGNFLQSYGRPVASP